jgi:type IV secretion system protein VirD4
VLRADPFRQGRRPRRAVAADLAGLGIVHDIKGENWTLTAAFAPSMAACCCSIRPTRNPSAYNPLLEVRRGEWEVRDVQNIADILVDPEGSLEKRNHWEKTSHSLLVGAILHVLYAEKDKTLAGVAAFLSDPRADRNDAAAMMTTPHLGEPVPHPVVASPRANCSTNPTTSAPACCRPPCRSSASTAIPSSPQVTRALRLAHRRSGRRQRPVTLYLVVPPSDINRTKPLIRLILNQIGRR